MKTKEKKIGPDKFEVYEAQKCIPIFFDGNYELEKLISIRHYFRIESPALWMHSLGNLDIIAKHRVQLATFAVTNPQENLIVMFTLERNYPADDKLRMYCVNKQDVYQYHSESKKTKFLFKDFEGREGISMLVVGKDFVSGKIFSCLQQVKDPIIQDLLDVWKK